MMVPFSSPSAIPSLLSTPSEFCYMRFQHFINKRHLLVDKVQYKLPRICSTFTHKLWITFTIDCMKWSQESKKDWHNICWFTCNIYLWDLLHLIRLSDKKVRWVRRTFSWNISTSHVFRNHYRCQKFPACCDGFSPYCPFVSPVDLQILTINLYLKKCLFLMESKFD